MTTTLSWTRKDFIGTEDLSRAELDFLHALARAFKKKLADGGRKLPYLNGLTVVNFFLEPSTRTRVAFEMAAKRLSADVINIASTASSLVKGETLRDTTQNIEALNGDLLVIRHSAAGAPHYLSTRLRGPVINAGDGAHEHPTQAVLDTFTLREHLGSLKDKKITILGDLLFSRVARSNIWALKTLGARVTLAGPATLLPESFSTFGVEIRHDLKSALADADAVMLLHIQHERQTHSHFPSIGEYTSMFGLNTMRASWLKPGALILHPGPINRGVEIDSKLADSAQSVILEQVTNGIYCRMAVLALCAQVVGKGTPLSEIAEAREMEYFPE
ncbi:MAG: aspartate carbamoyltransferase catalytic subunit [Verrucomicrobiota bacterium]|nr:aspartate carbamoyltransferase catalytic subunit [Verrucomicrobiota bacterium]